MSESPVPVSILGVSGFAGNELARLVAAHPALALVAVAADRWQDRPLGDHLRLPSPASKLVVSPMSEAVAVARKGAFAFLCTPNEVSARLAPALLAEGVRVIDLSGAFRLVDQEAYPRWYGFEHPAPALLAEAHYGLPEVPASKGSAAAIDAARLVANPGCYATAAILALAPLLAAGAIEPEGIYVDGKSGVTGAGRKVEERYLFTEVDENCSPYRVGNHQHTPEIEQALARVAGKPVHLTFVPHLLPVRRGLLVTAFARLTGAVAADAVPELFKRFYGAEGLVEVVAPEAVDLAQVTRTGRARVGARADRERRTVVATASLDNLMKGAASQALQNLCAMAHLPPPDL